MSQMKKILLVFIIALGFVTQKANAQFETMKDSVVQLFGVIMTADSLEAIPSVSIVVKGQNRGTISNEQGVFSIVVLKGDKIEFTSVGYKPKLVEIPRDLEGNQYSIIQLMVVDTVYLPATIIRPRPTREQFERDFVNSNIPADNLEIARQNTDEGKRRLLARTLPQDGKEATGNYLRQNAAKYSYKGQIPPMGILNPLAWADFIQAWKRGDFKNNK